MVKEDEKGQMQNDIQLCTLISVVMSVCFDFMKERMIDDLLVVRRYKR